MTVRRVWTPRAQLLPGDVIISDPTPADPDSLVEVDRQGDAPVPPPTEDTPPPDETVGALVTAVLALSDAVTTPAAGKADADRQRQRVRDATTALDAAAKARKP